MAKKQSELVLELAERLAKDYAMDSRKLAGEIALRLLDSGCRIVDENEKEPERLAY